MSKYAMVPFVVDRRCITGEDQVISGIDSGVQFVQTPEPEGNTTLLETPLMTGEGLESINYWTENEARFQEWERQMKASNREWGKPAKSTDSKTLKVKVTSPKDHQRRKSFVVEPRVMVEPPDWVQVNIDSVKQICKKPEGHYYFPTARTLTSENSQDESGYSKRYTEADLRRNRSMLRSFDMGEISEDSEFFADVNTHPVRRKSMLEIKYKELTAYVSKSPEPRASSPSPPRSPLRTKTVSGFDLRSKRVVGVKSPVPRSPVRHPTRAGEMVHARVHSIRTLNKPVNTQRKWILTPQDAVRKLQRERITSPTFAIIAPGKTVKYTHHHTLSSPANLQGAAVGTGYRPTASRQNGKRKLTFNTAQSLKRLIEASDRRFLQ